MPKDIIITFKVDKPLLSVMDTMAQKLQITRSELIRRAIFYYLMSVGADPRELAEVLGYEQ